MKQQELLRQIHKPLNYRDGDTICKTPKDMICVVCDRVIFRGEHRVTNSKLSRHINCLSVENDDSRVTLSKDFYEEAEIKSKRAEELYWQARPNRKQSAMVRQWVNHYKRKAYDFDAEDLEQELWLKALTLDETATGAYLNRVIRNAAVDYFRKLIPDSERSVELKDFDRIDDAGEVPVDRSKNIVKRLLINYAFDPQGLPVDLRLEAYDMWEQLTEAQRRAVQAYAHDQPTAVQRKVMERTVAFLCSTTY